MEGHELTLIILFPKSFKIGIEYLDAEPKFDYEEINIFLGIIQLQYKF